MQNKIPYAEDNLNTQKTVNLCIARISTQQNIINLQLFLYIEKKFNLQVKDIVSHGNA